MSRDHEGNREARKKPQKTLKEKRAEKIHKRAQRGLLSKD